MQVAQLDVIVKEPVAATSTSRNVIDTIRVNHARVLRNVAKVAETPSMTQMRTAGEMATSPSSAPTYRSRCENKHDHRDDDQDVPGVGVWLCSRSGTWPTIPRKSSRHARDA